MAEADSRVPSSSPESVPMPGRLSGKNVAILVAEGFDLVETVGMRRALERAGAHTWLIAPEAGTVRGWIGDRLGDPIWVDRPLRGASSEDYDGLVVGGAVLNQEVLRRSSEAARFVRGFFAAGKPVAAMCQGLLNVIDTGVVRDRTVTSFPSARAELINAGANWVDAAVVVDHGLVTSRCVEDLDDFGENVILALEARGGRQGADTRAMSG
jgi:protease I